MARLNFPKHDLYKVLGVESTASLDDIKKAYRDLCRKVHPDKAEGGSTPANNQRFQQVQEAWEILRDEVLRREYDEYRANSAKDSSYRDYKDADAGRRQKTRTGTRENTQSKQSTRDHTYNDYPGDTYGSKPNRQRKPYYEKWGDSYPDDPYETDQDDQYRSGPPPPFPGFHGPYPGAGPTPGPQYGFDEHYMPRSPRGPPGTVKLEDRIVAMRLRIDMRHAYQDLDILQADIKGLSKNFIPHKFTKDCKWCLLLENVNAAFDSLEELYDLIHFRLKMVETGNPQWSVTARHLPELLGILQGHLTRMRYSATAARVILNQLLYLPAAATEGWLFDDLEVRLKTMATPKWMPTDA
ncbi:DnaJ-domain-containing protein [Hypoxylon sp. NC0597]|nr:DnaJ-domain-containing protein [Hypoxylon sp. NC0597]